MTNYEWLLQMGGEERQAWFDAEHVDANDVSTRKGDVRADDVCANDANVAQDSREKLEADASELTADYAASGDVCDALYGGIVGLLDRQAAIAHREAFMRGRASLDDEFAECADEIAQLTAQVDELAQQLTNARADCEQYRELFSKAITQAAEIVNLQP